MSTGWNGIPIRRVGAIRRKLADMICQLTGFLVEAEDLQRTNPYHRCYEDCCAWDCYAIRPATDTRPCEKVHLYSWDTMSQCAKYGIELVTKDSESTGGISLWDYEITSKS